MPTSGDIPEVPMVQDQYDIPEAPKPPKPPEPPKAPVKKRHYLPRGNCFIVEILVLSGTETNVVNNTIHKTSIGMQ